MKEEVLESIDTIFAALQKGRWEDHPPQTLISAQGKLATYQSNLVVLVSEARHKMDLLELQAKQEEADKFLTYRRDHGMSIQEAQANARVDCFNLWTHQLDAKKDYSDLRGILDALGTMVTAIQVSLKNAERERANTNYQSNAL